MIKTRLSAASLLAALSILLSGCFFTPGKFASELVLQSDNSFSFTYKGEIFFLGLSQLAKMEAAQNKNEFEGSNCYDDSTFEERECTDAETAEQKAAWEAGAADRAANSRREIEQMSALMGGLDLSDPEAGEELAQKLERQYGWNSVKHMGDGLFNVDFAISGQLSHDFVFPVMEGLSNPTPFVQLVARKGNQVKIEAPGFAAPDNSSGMPGLMGGMAGWATLAGQGNEAAPDLADFPQMDGTFVLITDGKILANNTDEGPASTARGQALTWKVNGRTKAGPSALIDLAN